MRTLRVPLISAILATSVPLMGGCATIADDYRIGDHSEQDLGYTSVAGNIEVGRSARIGNAKTVSGNIDIGEQTRVVSLSSVAGDIRIGADGRVGGSISTVAGDINIARGCTIAGDVSTVAGSVGITDSIVKGKITLTSGKLTLTRSRVLGSLRIERSDGKDSDIAKVNIGANSEVGKVVVEKGGRVQLRIHRSAKVGAITGAEAEYYD